MKRLLAVLAAIAISVGLLTACNPPPSTVIDCAGAEHATITLSNTSNYIIRNCHFTNAFVQLYHVTNTTVDDNVFTETDGHDSGFQLGDIYGVGNTFLRNQLDAGGAVDDNIVVDHGTNFTVSQNTATGAWDCGIETGYETSGGSIGANTVTGGRLCAIGGWWWSSLQNVQINDNTLLASATFHTLYGINFENSNGAPLPDEVVRFTGVSIQRNTGLGVHVYVGQVYTEREVDTTPTVTPDDATCADPATNTYAGNSSENIYTYSYGCCSGVSVVAPASIQAAVDSYGTGTTFCLSGTFTYTAGTAITPKAGDKFIGPATLDGQNQASVAITGNNVNDVVVSGLSVHGFVSGKNLPVVGWQNVGSGWDIENNDVGPNTWEGIRVGPGSTVRNNHVHDHAQLGISGYRSDGASVIGNEVDHNGNGLYTVDEAGGMKFYNGPSYTANPTASTISGNNVHDNNGTGIWIDTNTANFTITENTLTNNADPGSGSSHEDHAIEVELACHTTVTNNTITGPATERAGIFVSSSDNNTISGNSIAGTDDGITLWMDNSRSAEVGTGPCLDTINNNAVTGNTVALVAGSSHTVGVYLWNGGTNTGTTPTGVTFSNHYIASDCTVGHWQWYATSNLNYGFAAWQAPPVSQDSTGNCTAS